MFELIVVDPVDGDDVSDGCLRNKGRHLSNVGCVVIRLMVSPRCTG